MRWSSGLVALVTIFEINERIRAAIIFIVIFFPFRAFAANVFTPLTSDYKLIFDEEFNGDALDTAKWNYNWFAQQPLPGGAPVVDQFSAREDAAYSSQQVYLLNGALHLKLEARATVVSTTLGPVTHPYVSGMVQTRGKFEMIFGYIEARMYVPSAPNGLMANWPAFWAVNSRRPTKEIDVMEGLSGNAEFHYHDARGAFPRNTEVPGDHTGWHIYGALFVRSGVKFFVDGHQVGALKMPIPESPVYLDLAQAAETGVGGPDAAPAEVLVDYVHAYSSEPGAQAVVPQQGYGGAGDIGHP